MSQMSQVTAHLTKAIQKNLKVKYCSFLTKLLGQ
jgi:hypothetical protein